MKKNIWIATANEGKVKDFKELLSNYEIKTFLDLDDIQEVEENADSFEGNAFLKAKALYEIVNMPVVADDSGLCVEKLNGFPGIHSNRWALPIKDFSKINEKLLELLNEKGLNTKVDRKAYFQTTICYYDGIKPVYFEGILNGIISDQQKGENGFGYSPIFIPDGYEITQAEMSEEERVRNSHRSIAVNQLKKYLQELNGGN